MTDRERAIVMAYTGIVMLVGDKLPIFYEYIEEKMGRQVFTHELGDASVVKQIQEASCKDFIGLCAGEKRRVQNECS